MSFRRSQNRPGKFTTCLKVPAFYSAYAVFGIVGAATSVGCMLASVFLRGPAVQKWGQKFIHRLFRFFLWYACILKLVEVDVSDLEKFKNSHGVIFVANHPSLLDVVLVIAQIPNMICLMNPSLTHNLVFSGQARLAGYIPGDRRITLVKSCREKLAHGGNLLIFPEGTRSPSSVVGPFKMGFAVIAKTSKAPVQCLTISVSDHYLGKKYSFFKRPSLPIRCTVRAGKRYESTECEDARDFGLCVEANYKTVTNQISHPVSLEI